MRMVICNISRDLLRDEVGTEHARCLQGAEHLAAMNTFLAFKIGVLLYECMQLTRLSRFRDIFGFYRTEACQKAASSLVWPQCPYFEDRA